MTAAWVGKQSNRIAEHRFEHLAACSQVVLALLLGQGRETPMRKTVRPKADAGGPHLEDLLAVEGLERPARRIVDPIDGAPPGGQRLRDDKDGGRQPVAEQDGQRVPVESGEAVIEAQHSQPPKPTTKT